MPSASLNKLSKQFLCSVSVNKIDFKDVVNDLSHSVHGEDNQDLLLSLTVDHPLALKYPLRVEYQQSFMRHLIKELEAQGAEISGHLYERHIQLLQTKSGECVHRHFVLPREIIISIRESLSVISNGTTGLSTWQATYVLINYCYKNISNFKNSTVLELGSGVGLCGIAVSLLCNPSHFIFSDCHPAVINALIENIKINSGTKNVNKELDLVEERITWSGKLGETKVAVAHLPWEEVVDEQLASKFAPKFVIASDVVYDPCLFDPLAKTLKEFANVGSQVILACTERNSVTLQEFLKTLESLGLRAEQDDDLGELNIIPYSDDCAVKIYKVF